MELGPQNHTKDGLLRPNSIMVGKTDPQTRGSSRFRAWGELRGLGLEAFMGRGAGDAEGILAEQMEKTSKEHNSLSKQEVGYASNPQTLHLGV